MARLFVSLIAAATLCACSPAADTPETPPPAAPVVADIPPPPADPLSVGSPEAKDDLYCSALIFAANPTPSSGLNPMDEAVLMKAQALAIIIGDNGLNAMVIAGDVHATHAAAISDAYSAQASADLAAGTPRISVDDCVTRAQALPVPQ